MLITLMLALGCIPPGLLAASPTQQGKAMDAGWCSRHGNWSGSSTCPGCSRDNSPPAINSGISAAELARMRREAEAAAEKARTEAEKVRVRKEIADIDMALKRSREIAQKVMAEAKVLQGDLAEKAAGAALGDELIADLLKRLNSSGNGGLQFAGDKESLFSKGDKNSAPVDPSKQGPSKLASDPAVRALDFVGIPSEPAQIKPSVKPHVVVPDPRLQLPDPEDIYLLFGDPPRRRWPGPVNPGPRLRNPLIEEEQRLRDEWVEEIFKASQELGAQWEREKAARMYLKIHGSSMENDLMFQSILDQLDKDLARLTPADTKPTPAPRSVVPTEFRVTLRSIVAEESKRVRDAANTIPKAFGAELNALEKAGALRPGENPFEKETTDASIRGKLDGIRGQLLGGLGKTFEEVRSSCLLKAQQALGSKTKPDSLKDR